QSASARAATILTVSSSSRSGGLPSAKPRRKSARLSSEAEAPARAARSTAVWMPAFTRPGGVTAPTTATSRGIASGRRAVAVAARHPGAHERDQLAAVLLRVLEGVEAAEEDGWD